MVEIKRVGVSEKGEGVNLRSIEDAMPMNHHHQRMRVFECKTCNKQFTSFQALGGHRASHKRSRLVVADQDLQVTTSKPKLHECSICGVEFAIGQALGGHMRRHRARVDQGCSSGNGGLCLDLSLAPSGDMNNVGPELELELGLGHVHRSRTPTMVELFH